MRTFLIVVFLLAAIPAMLGAGLQFSAGFFAVTETKARGARIAAADQMDVEGAWGPSGLPQQEFIAHIHPEDMSDLRDVRISITLPADRIFNDDAGDSSKSSVMLKVRKVAEEECTLIRETIANDCRVYRVLQAGRLNRREFAMAVQYDFTQKAPVGNYDASAPLRMESITGETKLQSDSLDARRSAYRSVAKECAAIRRLHGNCSIYAVGFESANRFRPRLLYSLTYLVPRGDA